MFLVFGTIPAFNAIFKESIDAELSPKNIALGCLSFNPINVELSSLL